MSHFARESESAKQSNVHPGDVEFEPAQAMAGAVWIGMVVVVPALSKGQHGHPPAVARQIRTVEVPVAKRVSGGIHQPSHVIHNRET